MNVLFHYAAGPALARRLAALPGLHVDVCDETDDAGLASLLPETEVLWHVLKPANAALIAAAPKLRLIQKIGVGVNTIDLAAAKARGIAVCNLPGTNARAVAEHTLLLMLAALRRLPQLDAALRAGTWAVPPALQDSLHELGGRTVGLIGCGAVPNALAPLLAAFGCRIFYTARAPRDDAPGTFRELPDLLSAADIVSLHVPLSAETERMIDAAALARMKPGAILVNTARGGLIDQPALVSALREGRIAIAALDVFDREPPDPADPLFALENVIVTPHVAWLTAGTFDRSFTLAADNVRRLAAGQGLLHRVA